MFDGDFVCRAALYPKFVNAGVFDPEFLLRFTKSSDGRIYALSVASLFLAGGCAGVHAYGRRAANGANARFESQKGRKPEALTEEVHYLGYYQLTFGDLMKAALTHYSITCFWKPENGSDEHFQIELTQLSTEATKGELRRDRQAATGQIYAHLQGPWRHICSKDDALRASLEAIDLPALPQ